MSVSRAVRLRYQGENNIEGKTAGPAGVTPDQLTDAAWEYIFRKVRGVVGSTTSRDPRDPAMAACRTRRLPRSTTTLALSH